MSWNIVVVVSDTLRTAYLSPYGNDWVHTPNLARFAETERQVYERAPGMLTNNPDASNFTYRQTRLSIQHLYPCTVGQRLYSRLATHVFR